jgi:hypothetical protein
MSKQDILVEWVKKLHLDLLLTGDKKKRRKVVCLVSYLRLLSAIATAATAMMAMTAATAT